MFLFFCWYKQLDILWFNTGVQITKEQRGFARALWEALAGWGSEGRSQDQNFHPQPLHVPPLQNAWVKYLSCKQLMLLNVECF